MAAERCDQADPLAYRPRFARPVRGGTYPGSGGLRLGVRVASVSALYYADPVLVSAEPAAGKARGGVPHVILCSAPELAGLLVTPSPRGDGAASTLVTSGDILAADPPRGLQAPLDLQPPWSDAAGILDFAVGAIRDRARRFSRRDALMLEVLSDHLATAARALCGAAARTSRHADDDLAGRVELMAIDPKGKVIGQTPGAGSTMARFFPSSRSAGELPETVGMWLAAVPLEPVLCVVSGQRRLELRCFQPRVRPGRCLVLYEADVPADTGQMLSELTQRETEIVRWVTTGKTNVEISCILGISARTVQKHLENVFAKLGVHTRAALVSEVLQRGRP